MRAWYYSLAQDTPFSFGAADFSCVLKGKALGAHPSPVDPSDETTLIIIGRFGEPLDERAVRVGRYSPVLSFR
jgi:hypothetical protein